MSTLFIHNCVYVCVSARVLFQYFNSLMSCGTYQGRIAVKVIICQKAKVKICQQREHIYVLCICYQPRTCIDKYCDFDIWWKGNRLQVFKCIAVEWVRCYFWTIFCIYIKSFCRMNTCKNNKERTAQISKEKDDAAKEKYFNLQQCVVWQSF